MVLKRGRLKRKEKGAWIEKEREKDINRKFEVNGFEFYEVF